MTIHTAPDGRTGRVHATLLRTVVAGMLGGAAFNLFGFVTFVLIGTGLDNRSGPLLDPGQQSSKMIAVWTSMDPLPMFQTRPGTIFAIYLLFGVGYAVLYRSVGSAWPDGLWQHALRLALTIWMLSCVFFELLGPFNLLGEPLPLVALELLFWAVMAVAAGAVVVILLHQSAPPENRTQSARGRS